MTFARKLAEWQEQKAARKAANLAGLATSLPRLHKGTYAGGTTAAAPKPEAYRDLMLMQMARGRPCLLLAVDSCFRLKHDHSTTVACHRNEGKGMGRKQSDEQSAWGCYHCHLWYDSSGAPREEKRRAFTAAHERQVLAWQLIATDQTEPERFRKAAQRALERLNATKRSD